MAIKNLTLKIHGQGHGWSKSLKSQLGSSILWIHIPLCQSTLLFIWWSFLNIWPSKSKVKAIAQGHMIGIASYRLISLSFPCQSALPFLRYSIFKIWPWKSMFKVMGEVTVQSHNVGLASYLLTYLLFHVNRPSHSWYSIFKIWPWKSRVKVKWPWCSTTTGLDNSIELQMV